MTQLTFDFAETLRQPRTATHRSVATSDRFSPRPGTAREASVSGKRNQQWSAQKRSSELKPRNRDSATHNAQPQRTLSLYDASRAELKQIGDLAQAVIARYDIVRQRREQRLRREAMRRAALRSERENLALLAH